MKHTLKLAAALGLSLPVFLGAPASAATIGENAATVSPAAEDDPIWVLVGQGTVVFDELRGGADTNQ